MQHIRTFVAVKISPELEAAFEALIKEMKPLPGKVKWVKPGSVHLTLKFLGEITPAAVERVFTCVEGAVSGTPKFTLTTNTRGAFPSLKRPRVFWIGLSEANNGYLIPLQHRIEEALALAGFPRENRAFKPHLTVGRVKNPRGIETVTERFMEYSFPEITFAVNEILVMKSELTYQGAIYNVQKAFPLEN